MFKPLRYLHKSCRNNGVILSFMVLGAGLLCIPFQHYISLSRYQHYSFAVFASAIGFLLQTVVSWKGLPLAGRLSMLGSFLYMLSFGLVIMLNPWMDFNRSMETEIQSEFRNRVGIYFVAAGIPIALLWLSWKVEEQKARELIEKTNKEQGDL